MKTYSPAAGTHIFAACAELVAAARQAGEPVEMDFNETRLVAEPNDTAETVASRYHTALEIASQEWRTSPAGVAEAQRRREDVARRQAGVDALIKRWPVVAPLGWDRVLLWAATFTTNADHVDVKCDFRAVAAMLEASGYAENFGVRQAKEFYDTPDNFGGYIMGQIINCLKAGMPPHPVTTTFIERWRAQFQTPA